MFILAQSYLRLSIPVVLILLCNRVYAAAFQIQEQNVTNLGVAYSGTAALAEDATTGYYNAAGLTRIPHGQLVLSAVGIRGDFHFTASSANSSLLPNSPLVASPTDNPGVPVVVPTFHIAQRINDNWVFGFNVTSPYGLLTEYSETGIVRYISTNSEIETINLSPSLAYEVNPAFSVAFGVDAEYAEATLETSIGGGDVSLDGFQKNNAAGWGYGWHMGVLWTPLSSTRLGLSYRSNVRVYTSHGVTEILMPYGFPEFTLPNAGTYFLEQGSAQIELPAVATFSAYHELSSRVALTGDIAWTDWSRLHTLRLRFIPPNPIAGGKGLDTDIWLHYNNAWRYAVGLIYTLNDHWLFRMGTSYDQTPTMDDTRTANIPDQDRIWAAIGGAYTWNKRWRIDAGYAHVFFKNASLNQIAPYLAFTQTPASYAALAGEYHSYANLVGIQIRYDFV